MWQDWILLQNTPPQATPFIYIGCMTGTSADNLADFTAAVFNEKGQPVCYRNRAETLPPNLQQTLQQLSQNDTRDINPLLRKQTEEALTDFLITGYRLTLEAFALTNYPKQRIILSPHGQTIQHDPEKGVTDQLLNGRRLAQTTGYAVVFRHRQTCIKVSHAAPLAPVLIHKLFYHPHHNTVLLNGGGIANIAVLLKDQPNQIIGQDTGPANAPLDSLIQHLCHTQPDCIATPFKKDLLSHEYDVNGAFAQSGRVIPALYHRLYQHPFFHTTALPKSVDRSAFNFQWINQAIGNQTYRWEDVARSIVEVIVISMGQSLLSHLPENQLNQANRLIAYGGLVHNTFVMQTLKTWLSQRGQFDWQAMQTLGYDPDFFESLLMAYLGFCRHQHIVIDLGYCATKPARAIPGVLVHPD